jgi:hypothetical protein
MVDGLVFYDQFGRLRPFQIALVSVGVAILLLGVAVVSAVQPEGSGGVDVGTWVEEESVSGDIEGDDITNPLSPTTLPYTDEPEETDPLSQVVSPTMPDLSVFSSGVSSPRTPLSPTRRRGPRYGTLLPEYAPVGAPTGFSIGLGAASPGFMLLPEGGHHTTHGAGPGHRGRSRSEGQRGIEAIMAGHGGFDGPEDAVVEGQERSRRRDSWWNRIIPGGEGRIRLGNDEEGSRSD